jgi:zinc D-Ala-D-Ala carboxypeptidase
MKVTPQNVTNYLQGNLKHLSSQYFDLPIHEAQQIALRAYLCKPCLNNGKCLICSCKTPEMFYAPNKLDSAGKFAQFLNKDQWETLVNNIDEYHNYIKGMNIVDFNVYFKFSEFDSPDLPGSGMSMQADFLTKLVEARKEANIPFHITSGFRTPVHNKKVKGEKNSAHLRGYAADIAAPTSLDRYTIITAALKVGFNRIGVGKTYVHLDNDPTLPPNVMWDYYGK